MDRHNEKCGCYLNSHKKVLPHAIPSTGRGETWAILPRPHFALAWGQLLHYQERLKYPDRTVTLIQHSGRYYVDNNTEINCSHIQFQRSISQKFLQSESSCIVRKYCDYTAKD